MKKLISTVLVLSSTMLSFNSFTQQPFTVSGKWERQERTPRITLYEVVGGRLERIDTARIQEDKTFTFKPVTSTEGFFVVGTGQPLMKRNNYTFYLKPGDQLNVVVDDSTYRLVGENTKENLAMEDWHNFIFPLERHGVYPSVMSFVQFFPLVDDMVAKASTYSPKSTRNPLFDENFAKLRKFDVMDNALQFFRKPQRNPPTTKDLTNYFESLTAQNLLTNSDVFIYPYSNFFLVCVMSNENKFSGKQDPTNVERLMKSTANEEVKGDLALYQILSNIKELWKLENFDNQYGKLIVTENQKKYYEQEKKRVAHDHAEQGIGGPGRAWTFKDTSGNEVSFSDLKGKIVHLDVWATWCGPCRAEFPHLIKTEEHFAGNENIVFLGISVDAAKDMQKWKDFIVAQKLPGIQLHSGDKEGSIAKMYNIAGIPRFLIFDRDGNIFSVDAPRPSSPELIPLLEKLLK